MNWHVSDPAMVSWVDGTADAAAGASVEQHLVRCDSCRQRVGPTVDDQRPAAVPDLEAVWSAITDSVQLPRLTWFERLLVSLRLPASDARLVVAAPSLRLAWLLGTIAVLTFVTAAAVWGNTRAASLYLMAAPLVPLVGVGLAYGPEADPAHELTATAPYSSLRLVLLRTAAVLCTSLPMVLAAGLFVGGRFSWLWLLPAAGFIALVLAFSTWVDPVWPTVGIAALWVAAVARAASWDNTDLVLADQALVLYAVLALAGLAVFLVRTRRAITLGGNY